MKNNKVHIVLMLLISASIYGQDNIYKNQNKIMGSTNPGFYGFGDTSKAGLIYGIEGFNQNTKIDNKFGFMNHFFEDSEFSLAIDVNLSQIGSLGYSTSQANLHYIYKATLSNDWVFNPSVSVGYGNNNLNFNSLVFQDQINVLTGSIVGVTKDPISLINKVHYLDIGAGISIHNSSNLLLGFNIKHINQPLTSFNSTASNKKEMLLSFQAGFEKNLNAYGQINFLPENSYLYLFNSFTKQGNKTRFDLYQEAVLGGVSFGLNQHFNKYEGFSVSELGTSLSIFVEQIEFGVNYSMEIGNKKLAGSTYSAFEIYIVFDFNPFKKNRRGNNSRFFDM